MTIVVGADGSVASRAALTWAIDRARSTGEDLVLATVVDDGWGTVGGSALAELKGAAERGSEREVEFVRGLAPDLEVSTHLAVGSPMLALAEAARDAALVAVGTHKVGYFHGHALGSRSLQLAAVSTTPTVVVPVTSWRGRSGVAVGVSEGTDSDEAVRFAAREAKRLGEALVIVHSDGDEERPAPAERAASLAAAVHPDVSIEQRSTADPASGTLIGVSRRAVLTVTGRRGADGRGFLPLGRTNSDLLMNLAGPVVVVPAESSAAASSAA
ncbi:universal stress protein [Agromyces sp. C10]|uniref:universal stress protein n=1 Tax=Agromyces sp. C10 TaxID=2935077 RepID=UPI00200A3701|nr:universal stress protein [Agromyces sp. C10]MCK8608376.1 universal stress protein [Agromyces sp. C10]